MEHWRFVRTQKVFQLRLHQNSSFFWPLYVQNKNKNKNNDVSTKYNSIQQVG